MIKLDILSHQTRLCIDKRAAKRSGEVNAGMYLTALLATPSEVSATTASGSAEIGVDVGGERRRDPE